MNKPIIIDGVDVSECCFFEKQHHEDAYEDDCVVDIDNYCCLTMNECNDLCYYKQLQRLKVENERLNKLTGIYSFRQMKKYKQALEDIQNVLFPKNKLLITDSKGLLKTQKILKEVLENV